MFDFNTFGVNKAILVSLSCLLFPTANAAALEANYSTSATQFLAQAQTAAIEPEILAEINRARTQPQAYADWLETQQQYYDGALLKLPGETTIRTNRGFRALQEAIAFLRQQQPLPSLSSSEALTATAQTQLETIANFSTGININIDNISYSLVTPQAIVMQLIVDDRFPDRRRRLSLFAPQLEQTGIACQPDARYDNICAIAYESDGAIASSEPKTEDIETTTEETNTSASNTATLPQPTQPRNPKVTEIDDNINGDRSVTEETISPSNSEVSDLPEPETGIEIEVPPAETTAAPEDTASSVPEVVTAQNNTRLLEKVERGALETGDKTIPDDGSFYDSYPLEGQAGDSYVISLESDEFDTFVAVTDTEGNILEQNDDISDENSNSRLRVTLPDKGVYSVIVNAYDEGGTGSYILTISR